MGKVAFLAACGAVLLSGLPGCEVLLNVGGLTERGLDDAAVAADTSANSSGDGALEGDDAAEASADGPMTPTGPGDASGDEGADRVADAMLSMMDSTPDDSNAAPEDTGAALDDARSQDGGLDAPDSAASTDGRSVTDGPVVDSDSQGATYRSCLAIFDAAPASSSGTYSIAPGGTPIEVHCDMSFGGGGWTLVQSTNGGTCSPATETAGAVALGSCAYMPSADLISLAELSTKVHVRPASGAAAPTDYITSATALPISNLRMGLVTNANETLGDAGAQEAAWTVVGDPGNAAAQKLTPSSILAFTCSVAGETWPSVYHACGNSADGFALDVYDKTSVWNWAVRHTNVAIEVYIR
jgi:hypothetical protein